MFESRKTAKKHKSLKAKVVRVKRDAASGEALLISALKRGLGAVVGRCSAVVLHLQLASPTSR